jgi:transglutaminase-like putative cysteine protease
MKELQSTDYLNATRFINSDEKEIQELAKSLVNESDSDKEKAIKLFYYVRDAFRYNPYSITYKMKATDILHKKSAHCVDKACLLAALGRAVGIPSRLGFGTVKNHIGTARLEEIIGTNVLAFHGYSEFFLDGKWVKATPAFNKGLCELLGVIPLEFDGKTDCLFQQYGADGESQFMEYLADYGQFDDIPIDLFIKTMQEHYPQVFNKAMAQGGKLKVMELEIDFSEK